MSVGALRVNQVLELWVYSKIGVPSWIRQGSGEYAFDLPCTIQKCASVVESTPGFSAVETLVKAWMVGGLFDNDDLMDVMTFRDILEARLIECPVYPVEASERVTTNIPEYSMKQLGEYVGTSAPTMCRYMNDRGMTVPGVFRFNKRWRVTNLQLLKKDYEEMLTDRKTSCML